METITRYHRQQVGKKYECEVILSVVPKGMAAFQIKGKTVHNGLFLQIRIS